MPTRIQRPAGRSGGPDLAEFPRWAGEVLTIDTTQPRESGLAAVLRYLS